MRYFCCRRYRCSRGLTTWQTRSCWIWYHFLKDSAKLTAFTRYCVIMAISIMRRTRSVVLRSPSEVPAAPYSYCGKSGRATKRSPTVKTYSVDRVFRNIRGRSSTTLGWRAVSYFFRSLAVCRFYINDEMRILYVCIRCWNDAEIGSPDTTRYNRKNVVPRKNSKTEAANSNNSNF